ncbi:hypothetical protein [Micromonospora sp. AKA38]|uniref:hypothetical protein n=1 Tax=Micromonospora sp. AKA38 TaxID=2733861 RepID=UPI0022C73753|nr:hypothetical protein [Micromonospora sp. AKA38]GHJ17072.1 hypothetical protein TPA0908_50670 [Micromonospora sp. AKA38]
MDVDGLPSSVLDVVGRIFPLLGVSGTIVALFLFISFVWGWYEQVRSLISLTRKARAAAGRGTDYLQRTRPKRLPVLVITTVVVPVAQLLTVTLCFITGNYISIALFPNSVDPRPKTAAEYIASLHVDWISGSYTVLALFILGRSYLLARKSEPIHEASASSAALLAWPAVLLGLAAAVTLAALVILLMLSVALTLLAKLFGEDIAVVSFVSVNHSLLLPPGAILLISALYWAACSFAVQGSQLLVTAWQNSRILDAEEVLKSI